MKKTELAKELRVCLYCGTPFVPRRQDQRFCSKRCNSYHSSKRPLPEPKPPKQCAYCGKTFTPKHGLQTACSEKCRKEGYLTKKGFKTSKDAWQQLREFILERDNYICQDCGKFLMDIGLDVHHIKPLRLRGNNDPKNLISLCSKCHKKRHGI